MYNIFTPNLFFEWDEEKNVANQGKHGVSFQEARSVFFDDNAREAFDPDHSEAEDRHVLMGSSDRLRMLFVSFCYRRDYSMIRIISARKLNKMELKKYKRMFK